MIEHSIDFKKVIPNIKFQNFRIQNIENNEYMKIKEVNYGFNSSLFKTVMKEINFKVKSSSDVFEKKYKLDYGLLVNNAYEYICLGTFFIKEISDSAKNEKITATGYDKMINFMTKFDITKLKIQFPCTMLEFVKAMCNYCETELYTNEFFNNDLIIYADEYSNQNMTFRDVLDKIAQATMSIIFIKNDKLYIKKIPQNTDAVDDYLNSSCVSEIKISSHFGPCNSLVLGRGDVEDNIVQSDNESIKTYGLHELRIDENEFIDGIRSNIISKMFNQIKNIELYEFIANDLGFLYYEPGDMVLYTDRNNNSYKCIILNLKTQITSGIKSQTSADLPEEITTNYKYTTKDEKKNLKVERLARKNEGKIQDIIEEQSEFSDKLIEYEASLEGIKQRVEKIEDFTREQTETNQLHLSDTIEGSGYITNFRIEGSTKNFIYLSPEKYLVPSDELVPLGDHFTLVIDNQSRSEKSKNAIEIDINLEEPLRNLDEIHDDFEINGDIITVIRRIGVNDDGSLYVLNNPITEEIGNYELPTFDKDTYIYIDEYYNLKYYAKYIINNDFSQNVAMKSELKSSITQSEKNINISVDEKLQKYATVEEAKAMIDVKADEINLEVSKKVGENELASKISQTPEEIFIKSNKFGWESDNSSMATDGKITATGGKIGGFELSSDKFQNKFNAMYNFDMDDLILLLACVNGKVELPNILKNLYNVSTSSDIPGKELNSADLLTMLRIIQGETENKKIIEGIIEINSKSPKNTIALKDEFGNIRTSVSLFGVKAENINADIIMAGEPDSNNSNYVGILIDKDSKTITVTNGMGNESVITPTQIQSQAFNNNSLESMKKNIEKLGDVTEIFRNSEIYTYNYKNEEDIDKKHTGFIIGKDYKTPKEVLSKNGEATDLYSIESLMWKFCQTLDGRLQRLEEKGENNGIN